MAPQAILTFNQSSSSSTTSNTQPSITETGDLSFNTTPLGLEVIVGHSTTILQGGTTISKKDQVLVWYSSNGDLYTLELIGATAKDIETIRKLLSRSTAIIGIESTSTTEPEIVKSNYRNSLVLVDEDENEVAVIPLTITPTVRGEELASKVDQITNHLFGRKVSEDNENFRRKEELDNRHQMAQNGGVEGAFVSISPEASKENQASNDSIDYSDGKHRFEDWRISNTSSIYADAESELDLLQDQEETLSAFSIPSFATKGSDLHHSEISEAETISGGTTYSTALGEGNDSRRTSSATFETCFTSNEEELTTRALSISSMHTIVKPSHISDSTSNSAEEPVEDDVTPRQSTIYPVSTFKSTNSFLSQPITSSLSRTNAVLLEFLGNDSIISTRNITSEEINKDKLVRASVEMNNKGEWAWLGVMKSLSSWLGIDNWFSSTNTRISAEAIANKRLSVLYYDNNGIGQKAYVNGRFGA